MATAKHAVLAVLLLQNLACQSVHLDDLSTYVPLQISPTSPTSQQNETESTASETQEGSPTPSLQITKPEATHSALDITPVFTNSPTPSLQPDLDGDGYPAIVDCNDNEYAIHPAAEEICDDQDNDCDGQLDEGQTIPLYPDKDHDSFGANEEPIYGCSATAELSLNNLDCNDDTAQANPSILFEKPDGLDNSCDGRVDEITASQNATFTFILGPGSPNNHMPLLGIGNADGDAFQDMAYGSPLEADYRGIVNLVYGDGNRLDQQSNTAVLLLQGDSLGSLAGEALASGDFNGDGLADVAVGQPDHPNFSERGRVSLLLGDDDRRSGHYNCADLAISLDGGGTGEQRAWGVGHALAFSDLDGDHFDDLLIGAPLSGSALDDGIFEGQSYLYYGHDIDDTPRSLSLSEIAIPIGGFIEGGFDGATAAGVGDLDGDGYQDAVIGAGLGDGYSSSGTALRDCGAIQIIYGGPRTEIGTQNNMALLWGESDAQQLGRMVAAAGDLNQDGYADFVVGAPNVDIPFLNSGTVYVLFGGPQRLLGKQNILGQALKVQCRQENCQLGHRNSAVGVGDINNDGFTDFYVGGIGASISTPNTGVGGLFFGPISPKDSTLYLLEADVLFEGNNAEDSFGLVGSAGDLDGDLFSDLMLGASHANIGEQNKAVAYHFYGY